MIYDIRHVTTYTYDSPVAATRCTLRLIPCSVAGQEVLSHAIDISPDARCHDYTTFFGTRTIDAAIDQQHRELRIEARSRVAVAREMHPQSEAGQSWEQVRDRAAEQSLAPRSPVHMLFASPCVPLSDTITAYAGRSFTAGRDVLAGAIDLMHRIRADFTYDPRATLVSTPLRDAFAKRRGVCQDFAHIMICGLRGLGLPAAYVSGYLRTTPPPGRPRLQGADATHAWVSVWCGRAGWIGLDPTNDMLVSDDHIVLSTGRDYGDVSPVDGIMRSSGGQRLAVAVDVIPVGEEPPSGVLQRPA